MMNETIIHIEDNPAHASLVQRQLCRCRPELRIVHLADGDAAHVYFSAAEQLLHNPPRLVLLDLRLPKIDGIEVLRQIRSRSELEQVPVIVLTTSNSAKDVHDAYRHGANSYLIKPLEFAEFQDMIDTLCRYWLDLNVRQRTALPRLR